jgi:O-succinylbenzoic acid--CoA ligase
VKTSGAELPLNGAVGASLAGSRLHEYGGALLQPFKSRRGTVNGRAGFVLELWDRDGSRGVGECAPLGGHSAESLEDCRAALDGVATRWSGRDETGWPLLPWLDCVPAARFAWESALYDLLARRRGLSVAELLGQRALPAIPRSAVVDSVESARRTLGRGILTLKVKVGGPDGDAELVFLRELRAAFGDRFTLRLDANGAFTVLAARERLSHYAPFSPELVEQPTTPSELLDLGPCAVPWAADESLIAATPDFLERLATAPGCVAWVIKPAAIGLRRARELALRAQRAGLGVVITHLVDGPIGLAAACELALSLPAAPLPCGLDVHPGLSAWPEVENPHHRFFGVGVPPERASRTRLFARGTAMELSVHAAAAECPQRLAVLFAGGSFTYAELAERVRVAAAALKRRGLGRGSLVAIGASNRWQTLVAILGLVENGIPFIPIHPRWTAREVAVIQGDAHPTCLFGDDDVDGLFADALPDAEEDPALPEPSSALAILYTSGTTGVPKGASLSRAAFIASARGSACNLGWIDGDRWLLCLPLCHIGGLSIVIRCLLARRTVVLLERYEAKAVLAASKRHRVTLLSVVPTMLYGLLNADEEGVLSSLRAVLCGGAGTPFPLLCRATAMGVNVLCTYGLTEACSQVTVQDYTAYPSARPGSGRALLGVEVSIHNEAGERLPAGTVGQIWVRGDSVMTGYLGHPPLNGGFFDTGDLGELDAAGVLYVHSRRTDLIVTGGENVYPLEVEQALLATPHVRGAIVFGVPDSRWGAVVAAAIVIEPGFVPGQLAAALTGSLAPFKQPRLWAQVDAIPELPSGKADRRRARELFMPRLQRDWE